MKTRIVAGLAALATLAAIPAFAQAPAAAPAPVAAAAGAADPSPTEPPARQGQIRIRRPDNWQSQAWPPEPPRRGSSLLRGLFNTLALVVLVLLVGAAVYFTAQEWTRPY